MPRDQRRFRQLPYQMPRQLQLVLIGDWAAKSALRVLFNGETLDTLELRHKKTVVMAVLIQAAQRAAGRRGEHAFVTAEELVEAIKHYLGEDIAGERIYKIIDELARRLEQVLIRHKAVRMEPGRPRIGRRLIETLPALGYRISLPPENLHIEFLDRDGQRGPWYTASAVLHQESPES